MSIPPHKMTELKQKIHSHLDNKDFDTRLEQMLASCMDLSDTDDGTIAGNIEQVLQQNNIVDAIMNELLQHQKRNMTKWDTKNLKTFDDVKIHFLYLQILTGRAFLDHLIQNDLLPGPTSYFKMFIHFCGQRFSSHLTPCVCEPEFNEGFLFELPDQFKKDVMLEKLSLVDLLQMACPIHLVLIRIDNMNFSSLVSSYFLEWRSLLNAPNYCSKLAVEMYGIGTENQVPVGILEIQLELIPHLEEHLGPGAVTAQLNEEHTQRAERERLFLVYAKNWWKEFLEIRPSHEHRFVKIFAQDENGCTHPVCRYITPLKVGRLLETPREAAWFVSLIPHELVSSIGGSIITKMERWACMATFLCLNKGDCEEHAVLLCSLLLGFGLDAYVCIGSKVGAEPYAWVLTLGLQKKVIFWDPLTSERYYHEPIQPQDAPVKSQPNPIYPFIKIGCVFNHKSFYANSQPTDSVFICCFDLDNQNQWKAMDPESLQIICLSNKWNYVRPPPLVANHLDPLLASTDLQHELQSLFVEYRKDIGLTTIWDEQLSYLMGPALALYELERKTGILVDHDEYNQAIRYAIPSGHKFVGFPIRFGHNHARRIFMSCLRFKKFQEILEGRGDVVRHAIHVRIYPYPENVMSSWILVAVKRRVVV